jgi:uncharacterized protein (DUF1810 family)
MYDKKNLERFVNQQEGTYQNILNELKRGKKIGHWMWYIFPQIKGLGYSRSSEFFNIQNLAEAKAFLNHPVLGARFIECCKIILNHQGRKIDQIFPETPDDTKFRSSMTLFDAVSDGNSLFSDLLQKYFNGARDQKTLIIINPPGV